MAPGGDVTRCGAERLGDGREARRRWCWRAQVANELAHHAVVAVWAREMRRTRGFHTRYLAGHPAKRGEAVADHERYLQREQQERERRRYAVTAVAGRHERQDNIGSAQGGAGGPGCVIFPTPA